MIVATTPYLAAYRVTEVKGQVFGLVVRSRGFAGNFAAGLRSLVGGEIHEYTELLEDTRRQALDRMVQNATLMGANAFSRCGSILRKSAAPCPRSWPTGPRSSSSPIPLRSRPASSPETALTGPLRVRAGRRGAARSEPARCPISTRGSPSPSVFWPS